MELAKNQGGGHILGVHKISGRGVRQSNSSIEPKDKMVQKTNPKTTAVPNYVNSNTTAVPKIL